jgi:hypothetical protein
LVPKILEKVERYLQLKSTQQLAGDQHTLLFFCADRLDKTIVQTYNRINVIRRTLLESIDRYLSDNFSISVGYYPSLLEGLISLHQTGDAKQRLANYVEQELLTRQFRVAVRDDYQPIADYSYKPSLLLAFNDSNDNTRLRIRCIDSFLDYDLSIFKRIGDFPKFYRRALRDTSPFRPVLWVIVTCEMDIRYLVKQYPELADCTEFVVGQTFYKVDGDLIKEVLYDVEI